MDHVSTINHLLSRVVMRVFAIIAMIAGLAVGPVLAAHTVPGGNRNRPRWQLEPSPVATRTVPGWQPINVPGH